MLLCRYVCSVCGNAEKYRGDQLFMTFLRKDAETSACIFLAWQEMNIFGVSWAVASLFLRAELSSSNLLGLQSSALQGPS